MIDEAPRPRLTFTALLFAAVAVMHLLPIWRVHFVPTIDGPSHLYNAAVLHQLDQPAFSRVFTADLRPHPNWLSHLFLWLALFVVPPVIAEKLLFSVIILLFLGGAWLLAGAVDRERRVFAFLAMPLAFHMLLQMGFYNYSLGAALVPFAVHSWWRRRASSARRDVAMNAVWLLLVYFAHIVPALIACLAAFAIFVVSRVWRQLIAFVPVALLVAWFVLQPSHPGGDWTWNGALLFQPLVNTALMFTFDVRQLTFGAIYAAVLAVCIVATLAQRRLRVRADDVFLLLTIAGIALYLAAPLSAQEGLVLKARLLLFPYLFVLPWLSIPRGRFGAALAIIFAIIATANVFYLRDRWKENAKPLDAMLAPLRAARPLHTFVPLVFDRSAAHSPLPLAGHTISYAAIEKHLVDLADYEAALGFFPVAYRPDVQRPAVIDVETHPGDYEPNAFAGAVDYIYTWKMPAGAPLEARLAERYVLVTSTGDARLYARKGL
ncbi:MAG TPA: hypothetical protein VFN10_11525 [Thermoanaerobaculia bacterium]|nr:hypothetical protein [Thermoanaerobaculia bacterium]